MAICASRTSALKLGLGALLFSGAWLLLAAIPVLADGGPHVSSANSGVSTLASDNCAGCHRAHTAQGEMLINAPTDQELCFTCHGAASTGATTDVMTGAQYAIATDGTRSATLLGALRGGGFDQARLASGTPARYLGSSYGTGRAKVSVGASADVTSSHLNLAQNGLTAPTVAWGNGGLGTGTGATVSLSCGSCHNPHGNGKYRILNPIPAPAATISGTFAAIAAPGAAITDAAPPAKGDTRNYTVLQVKGTTGQPATYLLYASQVTAAASSGTFYPSAAILSSNATTEVITTAVTHGLAVGNTVTITGHDAVPTINGTRTVQTVPTSTTFTLTGVDITTSGTEIGRVFRTTGAIPGTYTSAGGDYWHQRVPWNSTSGNPDGPNGVHLASAIGFTAQMQAWCTACHTRYLSLGGESGDPLFAYQHQTTGPDTTCTTCHVSHGSNARMPGTFSLDMPFPNGTSVSYDIGGTTGDSRLLKVDNRGTCQLCHDPTDTVTSGTYTGPVTVPGVP